MSWRIQKTKVYYYSRDSPGAGSSAFLPLFGLASTFFRISGVEFEGTAGSGTQISSVASMRWTRLLRGRCVEGDFNAIDSKHKPDGDDC